MEKKSQSQEVNTLDDESLDKVAVFFYDHELLEDNGLPELFLLKDDDETFDFGDHSFLQGRCQELAQNNTVFINLNVVNKIFLPGTDETGEYMQGMDKGRAIHDCITYLRVFQNETKHNPVQPLESNNITDPRNKFSDTALSYLKPRFEADRIMAIMACANYLRLDHLLHLCGASIASQLRGNDVKTLVHKFKTNFRIDLEAALPEEKQPESMTQDWSKTKKSGILEKFRSFLLETHTRNETNLNDLTEFFNTLDDSTQQEFLQQVRKKTRTGDDENMDVDEN